MIMKKFLYDHFRKLLYPIHGLQEGLDCQFRNRPQITIHPQASIILSDKVILDSEPNGYHAGMAFPVTLTADRPGSQIRIGESSRLHGCCIHAWSKVDVGRKCLIAAGAQILDANGHTSDMRLARFRTTISDHPSPILIEDYCWIGLGAIILKGAHVGEGCLIAAYSVVGEGEYPSFSLIAGAPARVIRTMDPGDVLAETDNPSISLS
jgi:acetyltransferase-like isoleucine patch superfamily enzyme